MLGAWPCRRNRNAHIREFYTGCYGRLVGILALAAGSPQEAEEIVQEAFVRLIPRWSQVSRYDDPEAWVRLAAFRLLYNRRRKARNAIQALSRIGARHSADAPSGDRVDLIRALRLLPAKQREAVVLHHIIGLDTNSVASELGVPLGTVKSRLSRGREALAASLSEGTAHARP